MSSKSKALAKHSGRLLDTKKWETKGAYHVSMDKEKAKKHYPVWGGLDRETRAGTYKRHGVPNSHVILTHADWAKKNMKKDYDKMK